MLLYVVNSSTAAGAQPFRYCRPHNVRFYELRPPVSSRSFYILHCFCSASAHWAYPASTHLFRRISTKHPATVVIEFLIMLYCHDLYFKLHVHGRTNIYRKSHSVVRPQVAYLCSIATTWPHQWFSTGCGDRTKERNRLLDVVLTARMNVSINVPKQLAHEDTQKVAVKWT